MTPEQFLISLSRVGVNVPPKVKANLLRRLGQNHDGLSLLVKLYVFICDRIGSRAYVSVSFTHQGL